jgi:hypothetical protein
MKIIALLGVLCIPTTFVTGILSTVFHTDESSGRVVMYQGIGIFYHVCTTHRINIGFIESWRWRVSEIECPGKGKNQKSRNWSIDKSVRLQNKILARFLIEVQNEIIVLLALDLLYYLVEQGNAIFNGNILLSQFVLPQLQSFSHNLRDSIGFLHNYFSFCKCFTAS